MSALFNNIIIWRVKLKIIINIFSNLISEELTINIHVTCVSLCKDETKHIYNDLICNNLKSLCNQIIQLIIIFEPGKKITKLSNSQPTAHYMKQMPPHGNSAIACNIYTKQ